MTIKRSSYLETLETRRVRTDSPPDLRGAGYARIPRLESSYKPPSPGIDLYPREVPDHPMPYFKTYEFLPPLLEPPWEGVAVLSKPTDRDALVRWWIDDFIGDVIREELTTMAAMEREDKFFTKEKDRLMYKVLEEEVIPPVLQEMATAVAWDTFEYWSRSMPDPYKGKTPPPLEESMQKAINAFARGEEPSTKLRFLQWDVFLGHYRGISKSQGVTNNFGMLKLQQLLIGQAAGGSLSSTSIKTMDALLNDGDEKEKVLKPPRQG